MRGAHSQDTFQLQRLNSVGDLIRVQARIHTSHVDSLVHALTQVLSMAKQVIAGEVEKIVDLINNKMKAVDAFKNSIEDIQKKNTVMFEEMNQIGSAFE